VKVTYIGLGSMGGDQARLIAQSEHDLTVYDVSGKAREGFREIATVADSIGSAVKDADAVHVCVRDADQVRDVLFGGGKIVAAASPGTLVVVHSTIDVGTVQSISQQLAQHGLLFADAPVTRTSPDDGGRFVLTMFGGDLAAFEKDRPVLETFSTEILHAGPCGAGMALKIANNMMTWAQLVIGSLTYELAESFQITFDHLRTVTKANGNLTPVTEAFLGGSRANQGRLTPEQFEFVASQAGIGEKDLALAIDACQAHSIDTRMIEIARELLRPAMLGEESQGETPG
jgi:3-hydroxyisobutyrate dehydrogenase